MKRKDSSEKILGTALKLFARDGYDKTRVDTIAEKAGVSKGLIYFYFKSKEEILLTLISNSFEEDISIPESSDPLEIILLAIEGWKFTLKKSDTWKLMTSVILQTNKKQKVHKLLKDKYKEYYILLEEQFKALNCDEPEKEATLLISTLDGLMLQIWFAKDVAAIESTLDCLIEKYKKQYAL